MATNGSLWVSVSPNDSQWLPMAPYSSFSLCGSLEYHVAPYRYLKLKMAQKWLPMAPNGLLGLPLAPFYFMWLTMVPYGSLWHNMSSNDPLWFPMASNDS